MTVVGAGVIGLTSAGSGTLMAIILIAVFRLTPSRVVGTSIFTAAVLLWAASAAHWLGGNIDFPLAWNILVGSIPGVIIGSRMAMKAGQDFLRTALAVVLLTSGIVLITKADAAIAAISVAVASLLFGTLFTYAMRREVQLPHGEGVKFRHLIRDRFHGGGGVCTV